MVYPSYDPGNFPSVTNFFKNKFNEIEQIFFNPSDNQYQNAKGIYLPEN